MAEKEKKKGSFLTRLVVVVVLAVAAIHCLARFANVDAVKKFDVVGMVIGYE